MSKVSIYTSHKQAYKVIDALYKINRLHIKKYTGQKEGLKQGAPLQQAEELSRLLLLLRGIKKELDISESLSINDEPFNPSHVKAGLEGLNIKVSELKSALRDNEAIFSNFDRNEKITKSLEDVQKVDRLKHTFCLIGTVKSKSALEGVYAKYIQLDDELLLMALGKKSDKERVLARLIDFKPLENFSYDPKKHEAARNKVKQLNESIKILKQKNLSFLLTSEFQLEQEIKKSEIPLEFATTAKSFVAKGYIPEADMQLVRKELNSSASGAVEIIEEKLGHHEDAPVKLKNNKTVRNFEVLTRLYELPRYFEIDPTMLLFLTFPIFFGLMLGDVGYGLVTLALFHFLKKKFPDGRQFFNVLIFASVMTVVFGVMYGEYFGFEHVSVETGSRLCDAGICLHKEILEGHGERKIIYSFPRLFSRVTSTVQLGNFEILTVLFMGIVIGAIHLNIGLLVGFYNLLMAHGFKHAFLEKLSWLIMEIGLALFVLSMTNVLTIPFYVGALIFAVSIVLLYMGEGAKGIIEIPALFSNMLSYMRIGAVGLASVGLAVVINENLAKPLLDKGGIGILIAIIVMIIGHLINIGLGVLGPFLHGIRLHYVEFFSKFFHGGGKEYKPFGLKNAVYADKARTGGV